MWSRDIDQHSKRRQFHTMRDDYNPVTGHYSKEFEDKVQAREDQRRLEVSRKQLFGEAEDAKFSRLNPILGSYNTELEEGEDFPRDNTVDTPPREPNLRGRRGYDIISGETASYPSPDSHEQQRRLMGGAGPPQRDFDIINPPESPEEKHKLPEAKARMLEMKFHSSVDITEDEATTHTDTYVPYRRPVPNAARDSLADAAGWGRANDDEEDSLNYSGRARPGNVSHRNESSAPYNIVNPPPLDSNRRRGERAPAPFAIDDSAAVEVRHDGRVETIRHRTEPTGPASYDYTGGDDRSVSSGTTFQSRGSMNSYRSR